MNTTLKDILDTSYLSMQSDIYKVTPIDTLINLTVSLLLALFIFYIYKKTFKGVLYQKSFNISLVLITLIVTLMIMTISENLILSLGMVGALSIVRFRTPIKDPIDLVFIFWAITVGIANGVAYYSLSIIGSLFITAVLLFMNKKDIAEDTYLLIIEMEPKSNSKELIEELSKSFQNFILKTNIITPSYQEITAKVEFKEEMQKFETIRDLHQKEGIHKVSLINYTENFD